MIHHAGETVVRPRKRAMGAAIASREPPRVVLVAMQ
jgi:hypothetical protein